MVSLEMEYSRRAGRWLIQAYGEMGGMLIQFPLEERVVEIWNLHVPGKGILVGSSIAQPVRGFYVEIDSASTRQEREKFLNTLGAESTPA